MKTMLKIVFATLILATLIMPIAYAGIDDYPRSDELYSVICANESITTSKAIAGEIDVAFDVRNVANVNAIVAAGWYTSALLGFGFHYIGLNSRQGIPDRPDGINYDYRDRVLGDSLFPLNVSQFRFALHLIVAPYKQQIISEVFDWTSIKIDTCPTPAAGAAWMNPPTFPADCWGTALTLLNSAGFYNDTAHTGLANGKWANTNSSIGPTGEIRAGWGALYNVGFEKTIRVMRCPEAALSTSLVSEKFLAKWNLFFGNNTDGSEYFKLDSHLWGSEMVPAALWDHVADMWGAGWTVGRDPDYLYDFFHPSQDIQYGSNHPGINEPSLNYYLEELKYTLYKNNDTIITKVSELQLKCKAAQSYIFYLAPYIVNRAAVTPNLFDTPDVNGWIDSLGYTAHNGYTFDFTYRGDFSLIRFCNPGTVTTLNPMIASSVYDWDILARLYDGFMNVDPFTKDDRMWCASSYTVDEWVEPGIHGMNVTFTIRPGIKWHDGTDYTAADAKFAWDFLNSTRPARYADSWLFYMGSEIVSTNVVRIHLNVTGFWYVYSIAGSAMLFPEAVWGPFYGDYTNAIAFHPETTNYDTHTGGSGHGDLTCLVGTGTWVFVEFDLIAQVARLMANRPFSIGAWTYTGRYWAYKFLRQDLNFDGKVDITDISTTIAAYGSKPGHVRWKDGQCDFNNDHKVDITDIASVISKYGKKTIPPY